MNEIKTKVFLRFTFSATHNWEGCDIPKVGYLKNEHRHVFHVEMKFNVSHDDRDIEFILMKDRILQYVRKTYENRFLKNTSCEMLAKDLLKRFGACYVSVSEDGENGAEVQYEKN